MMGPIAENRFVLTEDLFLEGMRAVQAVGYMKRIKKLLLPLGALWLLLAGFTLYLGRSGVLLLLELVALVLLVLFAAVLLPKRRAKRAFEVLAARTGMAAERMTRFYADHLEVTVSGQTTAIDYQDVEKMLRSPRLIVLVSRNKTGVLLRADAFTLGDENTVEQQIKAAKQAQEENKYA